MNGHWPFVYNTNQENMCKFVKCDKVHTVQASVQIAVDYFWLTISAFLLKSIQLLFWLFYRFYYYGFRFWYFHSIAHVDFGVFLVATCVCGLKLCIAPWKYLYVQRTNNYAAQTIGMLECKTDFTFIPTAIIELWLWWFLCFSAAPANKLN